MIGKVHPFFLRTAEWGASAGSGRMCGWGFVAKPMVVGCGGW